MSARIYLLGAGAFAVGTSAYVVSGVLPDVSSELHVSLTAAVPNGAWVEYIPQLDAITASRLAIEDGYAVPPQSPGLGIDWDFAVIERAAVARAVID